LTLAGNNRRVQRDFQLALWTALHSPQLSGSITVPRPLAVWSTIGGYEIEPGVYELRELADLLAPAEWPYSISLDVWCHSLGFVLPGTWAERENIPKDEEKQL